MFFRLFGYYVGNEEVEYNINIEMMTAQRPSQL